MARRTRPGSTRGSCPFLRTAPNAQRIAQMVTVQTRSESKPRRRGSRWASMTPATAARMTTVAYQPRWIGPRFAITGSMPTVIDAGNGPGSPSASPEQQETWGNGSLFAPHDGDGRWMARRSNGPATTSRRPYFQGGQDSFPRSSPPARFPRGKVGIMIESVAPGASLRDRGHPISSSRHTQVQRRTST